MVRDETGNYVLQGSTVDGSANVGDATWRDYALEFRGRVLKKSFSHDLTARVRVMPGCDRYSVFFKAGESRGAQIIHQQTGGSGCQDASQSSVNALSLELNRWYSVRIEAVGPRITVYLDGQRILELRDDQPLLTGGIILSVKPGGTVQYDDIRVINLAVPSEPTPIPSPSATPTQTPVPTATPAPAPGAVLQPAGLLHWWPADGNADDITGGKHGFLLNGAFVPGKVNQAFSLNGSSSAVFLPSLYQINTALTISAWVNFDTKTFSSRQTIFNNNQFFLRRDSSDGGGNFEIFVKLTDGTVEPRAQSVTVPRAGTWYHVAGTWDPSAAS